MKNYIRLKPENLGFRARTVGAGVGVDSDVVIPWRGFMNFQTVVVHGWLDSGTPNWNVRFYLYDWSKTQIQGPITAISAIAAMDGAIWWKDNAPRVTAGSLAGQPIWMNSAPYARFGVFNNDAASIVANLEIILYDGTGF